MISGATAQRVGFAAGKVLLRHAVSELGGKYVEIGVDLAVEVAEALAEVADKDQKDRADESPPPSPNDIVAVMRGMTPGEVGRSIDTALASADLQPLAMAITPKGKEELKQRAVAEMSAFDRLYREMDAEEAREAAERLEKKRQEIEKKRREKEAERLRKEAELQAKLAPLKAQLMECLEKRDWMQARTHAAAILELAPADRDALEADRRIDQKLDDKLVRAVGSSFAFFVAGYGLILLEGGQAFSFLGAVIILTMASVISFFGVYVCWPILRWWKLRQRG